jgi:hypothetical protein
MLRSAFLFQKHLNARQSLSSSSTVLLVHLSSSLKQSAPEPVASTQIQQHRVGSARGGTEAPRGRGGADTAGRG